MPPFLAHSIHVELGLLDQWKDLSFLLFDVMLHIFGEHSEGRRKLLVCGVHDAQLGDQVLGALMLDLGLVDYLGAVVVTALEGGALAQRS